VLHEQGGLVGEEIDDGALERVALGVVGLRGAARGPFLVATTRFPVLAAFAAAVLGLVVRLFIGAERRGARASSARRERRMVFMVDVR
jgi:hypothetical protein